jgi:hypothetical protein
MSYAIRKTTHFERNGRIVDNSRLLRSDDGKRDIVLERPLDCERVMMRLTPPGMTYYLSDHERGSPTYKYVASDETAMTVDEALDALGYEEVEPFER